MGPLGQSRSLPTVTVAMFADEPSVRDHEESDAESDGESFATENSDEEPLEGEPAVHVEMMLRRILDPDERQDPRVRAGLEEDVIRVPANSTAEAHEKFLGTAAANVAAESADSEDEDRDEAAAIDDHLDTLKIGLHDLAGWQHVCEDQANDAMQQAEQSASPRPQHRALPAAIREQFDELRQARQQLRVLVTNHHALVVHYTQQLLHLSYAQTELAARHHQKSRQRHKHLRIVRRESSRLCRCIERLNEELQQFRTETPAESDPHHRQPHQSPQQKPDLPSDRPTCVAKDGFSRRRAGSREWKQPALQQTPRVPGIYSKKSALGGNGGKLSKPPKLVTPALAVLQEREYALRAAPKSNLASPSSKVEVPPELRWLVNGACLQAAVKVPTRAASSSLDSDSCAASIANDSYGAGGHASEERSGLAGRRPRSVKYSARGTGVQAHDTSLYAYKPHPPARKPAISARKPQWQMARELGSDVGNKGERFSDCAKQVLRNPGIQTIIAEAFWSRLMQGGSVVFGQPVNGDHLSKSS
ncbi:hypothetical protein AB1Y20_020470 [Prymnesium parvum]|uniref:Uncharacterized protein n=1 Tax=Prymnesium parvum TaxID=97485 RepID=A0AB34JXN2_PRYPA